MRSSHSGVRRIAYTVSLGLSGSSSCGFSTHPLQSVGQQVIETFWVAQSTSGLGCDNQGCPMITDCCPRVVTVNWALSEGCLKHRRAWTSYIMEPWSLSEPSVMVHLIHIGPI